jgi:hypothetical protein
MKTLIATLLIAATPALVLAQQTAPSKPAASPEAKPAAKKPAGKKLAPSAQKAVEENTPIEDADPRIKLSEADLEVAKRVHTGEIPCELGASVKIRPLKRDGFFLVQVKQSRFVMHPVESRTGAIRLEDPARGAMWLQLGNKSMLMSQKLGQRLADECQSPEQANVAEALKKNPINLLEPAPAAAPAATAAPAAPPAKTN